MRKFTKFMFIIIFSIPLTLFSQGQSGQFKGVITDSTTSEPLFGANIIIDGTSIGTSSDIDGKFLISHIQPGNYKLRITYISYKGKDIDVMLPSGRTIELKVKLSPVSLEGEEVIVSAQALGQNEAINLQIASIPIKNVVSSTKIKELPDPNAAAALARLPGISVERKAGEAEKIRIRGVDQNAFYVNGVRMEGNNLSVISSSMMSGMEVQKSFTPDMDADVTGGAVTVKMNEAKSGFNGDIWVRQGYNGLTSSLNVHNLSLLLSNRFFDDKLGVQLSLSFDRRDKTSEKLDGSYRTIGSAVDAEVVKPVELIGAELSFHENMRDRYGTTLYLDYKLGEGKLYYQGFLAYMDWTDNQFGNAYFPFATYSKTYQSKTIEGDKLTFLNALGGEHPLFGGSLDWSFSLSESEDNIPRDYGIWGEGLPLSGGGIDSNTTYEDLLQMGNADIHSTSLHGAHQYSDFNETSEKMFNLNYGFPFVINNSINGFIKLGGKYRDVYREFIHQGLVFPFEQGYINGTEIALERLPDFGWIRQNNGKLGMETFVSPGSGKDFSILDDRIHFIPDFDRLREFIDATVDTFERGLHYEVNNFWGDEKSYAGYLMAGFNLGSIINITPGVRYEKVEYKTTGIDFEQKNAGGTLTMQGNFYKVTEDSSNENWFPMVQLKVKPTDFFDFRFAYSKTVSRPNFRYMNPRFYHDILNNISEGNMGLLPQTNYNYDIYASLYSNHIGLFTVGVFYKKLKDQVLDYEITLIDPEKYGFPASYKNRSYKRPINNIWPGYVKGLEFEWQTHFWYLPGFLDGFLLSANITFIDSETKYPFYFFERKWVGPPLYYEVTGKDSSRINKIIGQPDLIGNVTIGYEKGGFSGRISMYYQGETIQNAQRQNKALDVSYDDILRFDVQLSQKAFTEGLIFYLNLNNITNQQDKQSLTYFPQHVKFQENYGWLGDFGVRYKF